MNGNYKHGHAFIGKKTSEYRAWENMKSRCSNKRHPFYKSYGGRGIKVCDRWNFFINFVEDMGKVPPGMMLERVNNDGDYEPSNCCWATRSQQMKNRRPFKLVADDISKIKILKILGFPQRVIAEWFGVRQDHISRILSGKRWQRGEVSQLPS